jgi:actin-related protein
MSLFSLGIITGIVVDCGNRMQIVPVVEGFAIDSAKFQLTNIELNSYMARLLTTQSGNYFSTLKPADMEELRKMKEKHCFVSLDYDEDMKKADQDYEVFHTTSSGNSISFNKERFMCPEALFRPSLVGKDLLGIHENTFKSIMKCPMDNRREIFSNIVLAGGGTCFPGSFICLHGLCWLQALKIGWRRSLKRYFLLP